MKPFEKPEFLRRFGAWLLKLRKNKGLGQDQLTQKAGLARGTVSKIESGTVDPKVTTIARLAGALDITPSQVLDMEGS